MIWPALVPPAVCTVPIVLHLTDGLDENGAPREVKTLTARCNFNGKGGWSMDNERQMIRYAATALLPGDIAPALANLTGSAEVAGLCLTIHAADRARNPDGSVNYTKLELM